MIRLDDDLYVEKFNYKFDFFDHSNKTCNLEFCWPIVFFRGGEKPKKEEDWLNGATTWSAFVK